MDKQSAMYELGRHDERRRIMHLIGEVRERGQVSGASDPAKALDSLVMLIAAEPLTDYQEVRKVTK